MKRVPASVLQANSWEAEPDARWVNFGMFRYTLDQRQFFMWDRSEFQNIGRTPLVNGEPQTGFTADGGEGTVFEVGTLFAFDEIRVGDVSGAFDLVTIWCGGNRTWRFSSGGGMYSTNATGGSQGNGTINADAVYDDGTLLTDYVFDAYLGKQSFDYTDEVQEKADALQTWVFDPKQWADYWQENHKLPNMPDLNDVIDGKVKVGHGDLIQRLMEVAEIQAIHIEQLRERIERLENEPS